MPLVVLFLMVSLFAPSLLTYCSKCVSYHIGLSFVRLSYSLYYFDVGRLVPIPLMAFFDLTVLKSLDGFDVKVFQLVWLKVLLYEFRKVVQARFEHLDREPGLRTDLEVVPDARVQYPLVRGLSHRWLVYTAHGEERVGSGVRPSFFELFLYHENIYGENHGRSSDLRGSVVQQLLVDERERQDLQGHLVNFSVAVETEHPEVPVQELLGAIEVEVEAQQSQNLLL